MMNVSKFRDRRVHVRKSGVERVSLSLSFVCLLMYIQYLFLVIPFSYAVYLYLCLGDDTYKLRSLQPDPIYHVLCVIVIWYLLQIKYCLNRRVLKLMRYISSHKNEIYVIYLARAQKKKKKKKKKKCSISHAQKNIFRRIVYFLLLIFIRKFFLEFDI